MKDRRHANQDARTVMSLGGISVLLNVCAIAHYWLAGYFLPVNAVSGVESHSVTIIQTAGQTAH